MKSWVCRSCKAQWKCVLLQNTPLVSVFCFPWWSLWVEVACGCGWRLDFSGTTIMSGQGLVLTSSHNANTHFHDGARVEAWTVSVSVVVHHHCFWYQCLLGFLLVSLATRFQLQTPQIWPPSPCDASASLSFHVTSGGTDGGHWAQGVLGYRGDKPPRGSECGEPGDGGASPPRAGGLRQRPGTECGCPARDR